MDGGDYYFVYVKCVMPKQDGFKRNNSESLREQPYSFTAYVLRVLTGNKLVC